MDAKNFTFPHLEKCIFQDYSLRTVNYTDIHIHVLLLRQLHNIKYCALYIHFTSDGEHSEEDKYISKSTSYGNEEYVFFYIIQIRHFVFTIKGRTATQTIKKITKSDMIPDISSETIISRPVRCRQLWMAREESQERERGREGGTSGRKGRRRERKGGFKGDIRKRRKVKKEVA